MYVIKQSTIQNMVFYAMDENGDAITGLLDADFTKRISKNGGAFAAMTVTITEMEGGMYSYALSVDHTNTLGILTVYFTHSGGTMKQVNMQMRIEKYLLDSLLAPTVAGRTLDVTGTGEAALDLDNTTGTLTKGTEIVGFNDLSSTAMTALIAAYAPSLALTAYAPLTTTQGNALAASLALVAYNGPTHSELSAALTAMQVHDDALAASSALVAYDGPTHTEMTAELAALENIAVSDILAAVADGTLTVQDTLKTINAYARGRVTKSSSAFTYHSQSSVSLWVSNITTVDRNII